MAGVVAGELWRKPTTDEGAGGALGPGREHRVRDAGRDLNGEPRQAEVDTRKLLVEALREDFGLTGTHIGCLTGDCGACTVEIDGRIVKSCLLLAAQRRGLRDRDDRGLRRRRRAEPIQQAFWDEYGFQCGYCLPGMLFAAKDLLATNPGPDRGARSATRIDGNLCRCTGYHFIVKAVAAAAQRMRDV